MSNSRNSRTTTNRPMRIRRPRRKVCGVCVGRADVDYKEANTLKRYMTDRGKIAPRRNTGLCPKHQRDIAKAIKRSRVVGLVPYIVE